MSGIWELKILQLMIVNSYLSGIYYLNIVIRLIERKLAL